MFKWKDQRLTITLNLPDWMYPQKLRNDLDRRAAFNGSASRRWEWLHGVFSWTVSVDHNDR